MYYESADGGPLLRGPIHTEAVTIGRFHNVPIVPRAGGYGSEGLVALHYCVSVDATAQDTVDHHDCLSAGNVRIGRGLGAGPSGDIGDVVFPVQQGEPGAGSCTPLPGGFLHSAFGEKSHWR